MLQEAPVSNPNDFKVVDFHNSADFTFTPEMGCMYDGRPISGITGAPGVNAGESLKLPYHIGHQLAVNLAKAVMLRKAPSVDPAGNPLGTPLWDSVKLEEMKNSYLTELYTEAKPIAMTETDKLIAKVEEYKKMVDTLINQGGVKAPAPVAEGNGLLASSPANQSAPATFQDKQEIMAELDKRGVKHDKRKSKADLEKLLTPTA